MYLSAKNVTLAMWAVLTASAVASPVHAGTSRHNTLRHLLKRAPEDEKDEDRWCGLVDDLSTLENAEEALSRTTLGGCIEGHIRHFGSANWTETIQKEIYKNENFEGDGVRGCASLNGDCSPGIKEDCRVAFRKSKGYFWRKEGWWIFKAIKGFHTKMATLQRKLTSSTLVNGLDISTMAAEFEASMDDDRYDNSAMLEWVQVALGLGETAMGFAEKTNPIASFSTGLLGTVMGYVGDLQPEQEEKKVNIAEVERTLSLLFNSTEQAIERTLRAATGNAWPRQKDDYKALPAMTESHYESQIAKFFDTPFWLLDDASEPVDQMLNAALKIIRLHIVDTIVQGLGYGIVWDTQVEDAESCDGASRKWMHVAGKDRCFAMYRDDGRKGTGTGIIPKDSDIPATMSKWGIEDLELYYRSSIDCAKSGCSKPKKVGVGSVTDPGLPLCFFSAPVKKTEGVQDGCASNPIGCYKVWGRVDFVINQDKCPE